jgi:hypothetical protein
MKFRVIEDLEAPPHERFQVQRSPFGHIWCGRSEDKFADQLSAEIEMERQASGPRVIATSEDLSGDDGGST